jgi:adenosylhomocysteine nucleosidase
VVAGRRFHRGELHGREVVAAVAGIGKTSATTTAMLLIERFGSGAMVLVGVAGRVSETLAVGDVVVATNLVHHDLDASPLFPRYHVPSHGTERMLTNPSWSEVAFRAATAFVEEERGGRHRVARGQVLSGDQFMGPAQLADLRRRFPEGLAVEMEGAAVAQVCLEHGVAGAVVRTISDGGAASDFERFLADDCGTYASGIVSRMLGGGHSGGHAA